MKPTTLSDKRIGFAMCGSFCTFSRCFEALECLIGLGYEIVPIASFNAFSLDTRFGAAAEHMRRLEALCHRPVIHTIEDAEPIGPKKMTDVMLVANCTGNTLAKLAASITDTPVTMAVKSHIRNARPVLLNIATNDALAGSAKNIFSLLNYKNYFFVPMKQDDHLGKPASLMGDFERIPEALANALEYRQTQPILY
ncbi:MAG: dipicolinate synthase subunit B [Bacteroides sp.]|nr:dipicolinate synthase subunit B [Eubacterium sp.]MCM1418757.1 dipicolinate synthase subunit B [Roseburia sp.]MCM1462002.1 dipicolinate synthase subunit B [Bacteroides sp.]